MELWLRFYPSLASIDLSGALEAPFQEQRGENERAIKAAVVNKLLHGFDRMQLRINDGFHTQAHSQKLLKAHYCTSCASQV